MSGNYRDEIAAEIIARIEAGTAPWLKPWTAGALGAAPLNPITGKPYRGINSLWLDLQGHSDPRWLTYRQAGELGGQVRKGEKSTTIEYWQWTERTAVKDSEGKPVLDAEGREQYETVRLERPKVFYAKVFNAEQIDGLQPWKAPAPVAIPQLLERAETMIAGAGVPVLHDQNDRAFYRPSTDKIHLPPVASFKNQVAYYETVLHELGHATGHQNRLNREFGPFGGEVYAREELRAEIASYMLARDLGISFDPSNHAAYVKSWLKVLTEDKNEIFRAARDAEVIKTWVMEPERRQELERTGQVVSVEKPIREEMSMTAAAVAAWNSGPTKEYTEWQELGSGYAVRESTTHPVREIRAPGGQVLIDGIDSNGKHYNEYEFSSANPLARGEMAWVDKAQNYISGIELPKVGSAFEKAWREQNLSQQTLPHQEREAVGQVEKGDQPPVQSPRVYLDVPFSQKDAAKAAGARWDKDAKSWYVTAEDDPKNFAQWLKSPSQEPVQPEQKRERDRDIPDEGKTRQYIAVPYSERNEAKAAGAKWDRAAKSWYVPEGSDPGAFSKWAGKSASRNEMSPIEEFAQALKDNGLKLSGDPVMDGNWHRVPVEGDKGKETNGSYRGFLDGRPAGNITNFKAGRVVDWVATGVTLSDQERAQILAEAANVRAAREADRQAGYDTAAKKAYGVWVNLPDQAHPENCAYLAAKGVKGHGVKVNSQGNMIIPCRDESGRLWNIQTVSPQNKLFLKDSRKEGTFHVLEVTGKGTLDTLAALKHGTVIIAEGYATAATIFEETGRPVIAAFDSGNLKTVAEAVRAKFPGRPILIAADNDHANVNGNVGMIKAEEAAKAVGGTFVAPKFTPEEQARKLTDFNDLKQARGNGWVRRTIEDALSKSQGQERGIA